VLRNLPHLLAVVRGDLRLVGVAPLTPEQSATRTEDWQRVRDQAPVGLLGPTQLNLPEDAPLEERLLSDAFYAKAHSWKKDMKYLLRGFKMLFNADGWRRSR
jgi:lipopolysaccharide/colanic/teichoic acid biosynthesis glycosyltransferase